MASGVTFFEISGPQPEQLAVFYRSAFGWQVESPDGSPYLMASPGRDGAVPGGVFDAGSAFADAGAAAYAIPYIEVDDVELAVQAAVAAGGTVALSARDHGPTISAHVCDPAGNRVGVFQMK